MTQLPTNFTTSRREFLLSTTTAIGAGSLVASPLAHSAHANDDKAPSEAEIRAFIKPLLKTREQITAWLNGTAYPFSKFDSELGYLHRDRDLKEGMDGATCQYRYDKLDARRMIAYADRPCRINTYGNSFTSCEQVSDGETWQEALAAHLGEPLRNYGIGGYSVYQAYLRMKREERRAPTSQPSRYVSSICSRPASRSAITIMRAATASIADTLSL